MVQTSSLYEFCRVVTPPFFFDLVKRSPLYSLIKKIARKVSSAQPEPKWLRIRSGQLKGRELYLSGTASWQEEMLNGDYDKFIYDFLDQFDLTGKTIFDIGAHIGIHSMGFAALVGDKGQVVSFEPNPFNLERFRKILDKNTDLADRITLVESALSDRNGTEDFLLTDQIEIGSSSGSFLDSADTFREKTTYETSSGFTRSVVNIETLDNFMHKEISSGPSLLKIDVEGAENLVITGAEKTIRQFRPVILMEVHSIFNMYTVNKLLKAMDYKLKLLKTEKDGRCFVAALP